MHASADLCLYVWTLLDNPKYFNKSVEILLVINIRGFGLLTIFSMSCEH